MIHDAIAPRRYIARDAIDQMDIPFTTEADALVSSLVLKHRIPTATLDLVLSILRNPSFDLAQLTLQKATDILKTVAEVHNQETETRSTRGHIPDSFPQVILEQVLDVLAAERRDALRGLPRAKSGDEAADRDKELRTMSLVCRAWTSPAQRALGS